MQVECVKWGVWQIESVLNIIKFTKIASLILNFIWIDSYLRKWVSDNTNKVFSPIDVKSQFLMLFLSILFSLKSDSWLCIRKIPEDGYKAV